MKIDKEIKQYGNDHNVPITLDDTLCFLLNIIKKNASSHILEIGTAIGYGCITMAQNTNCQHIDTVEKDDERYGIAIQNIKKCNLDEKITVYHDDALHFLENCDKKYDLVYLDGPKGQYITYLPLILNLLNKGGIIVADNLNFHGMVTGEIPTPRGCRAMIKGLKRYIEAITSDDRLQTTIYTNIGDGVGVTKLK
ncbi:MAG: O-methyltransferase [Clostridiales bacterium]|nr:O-methyltransferase [Clostridiales bacterium]